MPPIATLAAGAVGIGKTLGVNFGGIFGGSPEKNAGSSSFVDALDNYESMPNSTARRIVPAVTQLIANGAGNAKIAEYLAAKGGEKGNGSGWKNSWKWDIVQKWIDKSRALQATENKQAQSTGISQPAGKLIPGKINPMYLFIAGAALLFGFKIYSDTKK